MLGLSVRRHVNDRDLHLEKGKRLQHLLRHPLRHQVKPLDRLNLRHFDELLHRLHERPRDGHINLLHQLDSYLPHDFLGHHVYVRVKRIADPSVLDGTVVGIEIPSVSPTHLLRERLHGNFMVCGPTRTSILSGGLTTAKLPRPSQDQLSQRCQLEVIQDPSTCTTRASTGGIADICVSRGDP